MSKMENRIKLTGLLSNTAMAVLLCSLLWTAGAAQAFEGLGRLATSEEVKAWDIDVRPDFVGLPKGSGSVAKGMEVWEAQCASCHGVFGESNEIFTPIVGGTTAEDIKKGRVQSLKDGSSPQRTTLMKVPTLSTLWDYINRAMPWTAPKSLSTEEVYAVTAYILNMGGIVGESAFRPYFYQLLSPLVAEPWLSQLSFVLSFITVTSAFILVADLMPKRIAMAMPEPVALAVVGPMSFCIVLLRPLVWFFNGMASLRVWRCLRPSAARGCIHGR